MDAIPNDDEPLYFFYDCETTRRSYHCDHIIEVATSVIVPDGTFPSHSFPIYVIHLVTLLGKVINDIHILLMHYSFSIREMWHNTIHAVYNQPMLSAVLQKFLQWISACIGEVQQQKSLSHYPGMINTTYQIKYVCPVMVAHNGFSFDLPFLVAEVKRRKLDEVVATVKLYFTAC